MDKKLQAKNYLDQVLNDLDRQILNEALQCYVHDLNRASYIMIWVSIVESLKRKLYQLVELEYVLANEAIKKIEQYENESKSTDRLILDESVNCGIVTKEEKVKLLFIWTQRSIFAHPYYKVPIDSEILHAVDQALIITLSKAIVYDKKMIDEILNAVRDIPYFVEGSIEAAKNYANNLIKRIPASRYQYTFNYSQKIIFDILQEKVGYDSKTINKFRSINVIILQQDAVKFKNDEWNLERKAGLFPRACWLGFAASSTWGKLPERVQDIMINYVTSESIMNEIRHLSILKSVYNCDDIKIEHRTKLKAIFDDMPFEYINSIYADNNEIFYRIIDQLKSTSFKIQNIVISYLNEDKGKLFLQNIDFEKCIVVASMVRIAAFENNFMASELINKIFNSDNNDYSDEFKFGLIIGCFLDKEMFVKFHYKLDEIYKFIDILNNFDNIFIENVFNFLEQKLKSIDKDKICYQSEIIKKYIQSKRKFNFSNIFLENRIIHFLNHAQIIIQDCPEKDLPF
jgi:hypothetical protein